MRVKAMMIGLGLAAAVALVGCGAGYYDGYYTSGYGYGGRDYYSYPYSQSYPSYRYGYAYPRRYGYRGYRQPYAYPQPYAYGPRGRVVPPYGRGYGYPYRYGW